jgi:regulatory protein
MFHAEHRRRSTILETMSVRRARRTAPEDPDTRARHAADPAAAQAAAVALLARRDRASAELSARLIAQGFAPAAAAEALAALTAQGAVNDERYAHNYVAYHAARGQGPVRIAAELRARGLAEALIAAALEGGPDWRSLASAARIRRFGRQPPPSWREKARQARFLQYRGFSADHIRAVTDADSEPD